MNWLRRMLYGRYGSDYLGRITLYTSMGFIIANMLFGWRPLYWAALVLLAISYIRIFSKNISARRAENERFLRWWYPLQQKLKQKLGALKDQKTHLYCKCPACAQKVRVPRGRGTISITCPKCACAFPKKT